jgi:hypothetical protein
VISNSYGEAKGAGLLRTLTPKRETTDIITSGNLGGDMSGNNIKQTLKLEDI